MRRPARTTSRPGERLLLLLMLGMAASAAIAFPNINLMHGAINGNVDGSTTVPVVMLHMDGTNGSTTIMDAAGGVVTAMGSAALSTATAVMGTASLSLPGTAGSYVKLAQGGVLAMDSADFTIEAFVKTSSATTQTIVGQWDGTNAASHTIFVVQSNGALGLALADLHVGGVVLSGGSGANDGKWHHVAYTRSGNTHTLWLDGTSVGSITSSASRFANDVDVWVGQYQCCNAWPFNGSIDELRITKGKALYTSSFLPPTSSFYDVARPSSISNLKLWLRADSLSGTTNGTAIGTWTDASGNGFSVTQATGGAQPLFIPNQINGFPVLRFNGTSSFLQGSFTGGITSKTMFAVCKLATLTPSGTATAGGPVTVQSADGTIFDAIIYNEITAKRWMNGSDNGVRSPSTISPTDESSLDTLLMAIRSTTSSYTLYRNTAVLQSTSAYSPPTITAGKFNVGYRHTGGGSPYFYGDIAEVIIYDKALTDSERQTVEAYLVSKYGIQ